MKSQPGENHCILKAVNTQLGYGKVITRKEGEEQLMLMKLFGAHKPNLKAVLRMLVNLVLTLEECSCC